jgi:hypothetical protein
MLFDGEAFFPAQLAIVEGARSAHATGGRQPESRGTMHSGKPP